MLRERSIAVPRVRRKGVNLMSDWNIPADVDELFRNGEVHYHIHDYEQSGDNIFAMQLFLEYVDIPEEFIVEDNGTQIIVSDGERTLCIDSGGEGDFHLHGYDVSEVTDASEDN